MAEIPSTRLWIGRMTFLALICGILFVQILPLGTLPPRWAGPDLILAVTLVWLARRPDFVPVLLIAAVFLLTDLLQHRPPGLWTALVVLLTEALRAREAELRTMPYLLEWMTMGFGIIVITLADRLVLALLMMPQTPLALAMGSVTMTVLVYPVVAAAAHFVFGVSRPGLGAIDASGRRL